ncbi:MAG TPA: adenylate/guanylate cyclase domain-containing protein [Burkholderiales bacterium]|nr:adenylate/guanylate cyclase domain-containing protein [Burkholderiales bacterium]
MPGGRDERIAILDIDERSLAEVGRWPWSRRFVRIPRRVTPEAPARRALPRIRPRQKCSHGARSRTLRQAQERRAHDLFADIRGFTGISESLSPEALRDYIDEYLTAMSAVIRERHGGTLDKYIGDAIMAFWGAPIDDADHALNSRLARCGCRVWPSASA